MAECGWVSERVISEIAEHKGISEKELPPLYDSIEPDALDEMFCHTNTKTGTELEVRFTYAGYTVVIRDPSEIILEK
ncbi:HalOD1 output domain-containing protein [Haloglomus litoreum]|uniref:HalOD1 output domain-containing protein n=1 Tax=Haloglomus litoreum TaxID=3034026 RepID=UPI003B221AC7